jgi:transcription elongation factor GreA
MVALCGRPVVGISNAEPVAPDPGIARGALGDAGSEATGVTAAAGRGVGDAVTTGRAAVTGIAVGAVVESARGAAIAMPPDDPEGGGRSPNHVDAATAPRTSTMRARGAGWRIDSLDGLTVVRTIPRGHRGYHPSMSPAQPSTGAAQLLRSVGLLADGPGLWGRPVAAQGPGVFVIELGAALPTAPIDIARVGKWIERVETLRLDGARPTGKALAARLASFWLPSQTVLYIGSSEVSVARRTTAMARTELGDRRPYAGGHWLRTLRSLDGVRVWWSATTATEEYEDALFDAFAAGIPAAELAGLPDRDVVLPFANLRRAGTLRKATGLTGTLLAEPVVTPPPATTVVELPDGDAEGARGEPPEPRRRSTARAGGMSAGARGSAEPAARTSRATRLAEAAARAALAGDEGLTAEGSARLRAELDHLVTVKRPEVIARIRTAKEHGDLKENSEYHAAREEQSFLEGRVQALEARLRTAVIVDAPLEGARVGLGSRVTVEVEGETLSYTIVGASESDPTAGRISSSSPVGRALVGRDVGDEIIIRTPAGERHYRIVELA